MEPTSTAVVTRFLRTAFDAVGLDTNRIFAESGIDLDSLDGPAARIPHQRILRMWDKAAELSGDPCFGLKLGQTVPTIPFNTVGYLAMSSRDLREIILSTGHYAGIFSDTGRFELVESGQTATVFIDLSGGLEPNRTHTEFWMVFYLRTLNRSIGCELPIDEVGFRHRRPANRADYRAFFDANVKFSQEKNYITFARAHLNKVSINADPVVHKLLEAEASQQLTALTESGIVLKAKRAIFDAFPAKDIALEDVAETLHLTPRTVQRRLAGEGVSFRQLVDQVRQEYAKSALRNSDVPVSEIAYRLGYLDVSSFYRAFKRWCGTTPVEYRTHGE